MLMMEHPVTDSILSDAKSILSQDKKPVLKVSINATHSGLLTNMRVYPSSKVMNGYKSFFSKDNGGSSPVGAPILTHHDTHKDPIGRIHTAKFTALKTGIDFSQDYLYPDSAGGSGSGVVTVDGVINHADSIEKILDSRFLSVSAGHGTNRLTCSVCAESIFSCNHVPGRKYTEDGEITDADDGFLCYTITGDMQYHEVSFVNIPAQPPAKLVQFEWSNTDSYKGTNDMKEAFLSLTKVKKDSIKELLLCDNDIELSLLSGKDRNLNKKTYFVQTSTADKITKQLTGDTGGKSINDGQHKTDSTSQDHQTDLNNKPNKGANMDEKELEKLRDELKALQTSLDAAKKELEDTKKLLEDSKAGLTAKDEEIKSLKDQNTQLTTDMTNDLAESLAANRIRLKKPDTIEVTTDEKRKEFVEKLAKRSIDSLRDSLADLLTEVDSNKVTGVTTDRLETPTLHRKEEPKNKKDTKKSSTGLDSIID